MCRAEHHIRADQAAAADVSRAVEVAVVETTSQTDLMTSLLQLSLGAIDNASRIVGETRTYLILA